VAEKKRFIVLGLGSFGTALALRLTENGARVTGVDQDESRVAGLRNDLYEVVVGDVRERGTLAELMIDQCATVFISLGEDIERSLLAALHARELKAPRIVVKGVTTDHGKILKSLKVDRIIFPEVEMAQELADRELWPNVLDFLPIDQDHSVVEIAVPEEIAGETLAEADLRRRYGIHVLGIKDAMEGSLQILPTPETRFHDEQILLVLGHKDDLEKFRGLK